MPVRLLQKAKVPLKPVLALPLFDLRLHARNVSAELEALAVAEPDVVVGVAFEKVYAFGFEGGAEVVEGFAEEVGKEEEGGALVEALEGVRCLVGWRVVLG